MKYKMYSNQHQSLYNEIFSIPGNKKHDVLINKEANYLVAKYKSIREDFITLGKSRVFDALFSDVFIGKKDKIYMFEHIILRADNIYVLERDNGYGNQDKLLKEKASCLKKMLGNVIEVYSIIVAERTNIKESKMTLLEAIAKIESIEGRDKYSDGIKDFISKKHINIGIKDYFRLKHNINVSEVKVTRKSKRITLPESIIPNFLRIKSSVSFLSSSIMLIYGLCALLSSYNVLKITNFKFTFVMDIFYGWFLYKILSLIEAYVPKVFRYIILMIILLIFGVFFYRILQFM